MKKSFIILSAIMILSSLSVSAGEFDSLDGITPAQKQKLSQIHFNYKTENNALEQKIIQYNNQIYNLKNSAGKTQEEINTLTKAYERNITTLKEEQKQLEENTNILYKEVLTEEQFKQYELQKNQTENAFNKFLIK